MSLDVQNPKGIQIKVTSTSTESKSIFKLMHSYHFLKANNGNILQSKEEMPPGYLGAPLISITSWWQGRYRPFASPLVLRLPSLLRTQKQNSVCLCPTWGERETKPVPVHWMPWPQAQGRACPLPYPNTTPPLSAAQRRPHTASLQGPWATSHGTIGFQNLTEYARTHWAIK